MIIVGRGVSWSPIRMNDLLVWWGRVRRNRSSRGHALRILLRVPYLRRTARTGLPGGGRRRAGLGSLSGSRRRDMSPPAGLVVSAWRTDLGAPRGYDPH